MTGILTCGWSPNVDKKLFTNSQVWAIFAASEVKVP